MSNRVDVDSLVEQGWTLKTPEEAKHRRRKDLIVFVICICFLVAGAGFSVWVFLDPRFTPEQKTFGNGILTAIMGGIIGYTLGKQGKA